MKENRIKAKKHIAKLQYEAKRLVEEFIFDYFDDIEGLDDVEYYAVGDDWLGVISISDMFLSINEIQTYFNLDISSDTFSSWYWETVENYETGGQKINLESYAKGLKYEDLKN